MREQGETTDGLYVYSLCDRCNSKTGNRYGSDYSRFIDLVRPVALPQNVNENVEIYPTGLHPLRIIKQATSMMLSTSSPTDFSNHEFVSAPGRSPKDLEGIPLQLPEKQWQREIFDRLRTFVRQRDSSEFPSEVRVYLFASVGRRLGFSTGVFTQISLSKKTATVAVATGLQPVHWIFTIGGELDDGGILDVTAWTRLSFKQPFSDSLAIPMRWLEGHYPLDFRSPQELYTTNFAHSMQIEGLVPTKIGDEGLLLEEAIFFARTLGMRTSEGFLISSFSTGTFYEYGNVNGWLPDGNSDSAIRILRLRLSQGE